MRAKFSGSLLAHPEELRRGEAGKGDVRREGGELFLADDGVEILRLLGGAPVVPEDGGADHRVLLVQGHQAVHLPAAADAPDLGLVQVLGELQDAVLDGLPPVRRVLLGPAGLGEIQGIVLGNAVQDLAGLLHQQQLYRRCAQIDADKESSFLHCKSIHLRSVSPGCPNQGDIAPLPPVPPSAGTGYADNTRAGQKT